jgi:hypothetical protein
VDAPGATGLVVASPTAGAFREAIEALRHDDHPVFAAIGRHPVPLTSDAAHLERLTEVYASVLAARRRLAGAA